MVQLPGTWMGDHSPARLSAVAAAGRGLIWKSHTPSRLWNQGDASRSSVRAASGVGNGINVARGGSLLSATNCGICQVGWPPRNKRGRGDGSRCIGFLLALFGDQTGFNAAGNRPRKHGWLYAYLTRDRRLGCNRWFGVLEARPWLGSKKKPIDLVTIVHYTGASTCQVERRTRCSLVPLTLGSADDH